MKSKVLIVGPAPIEIGGNGNSTTGVANVIQALLVELREFHELTFYATNMKECSNTYLNSSDSIKYVGYDFFDIKYFPIANLHRIYLLSVKIGFPFRRLVFYYMNLKRILVENKVDIVHVHNVLFLPLLELIQPKLKVVVTYHGNFYKDKAGINSNKNKNIDIERLYKSTATCVRYATFLTPSMLSQCLSDLNLKMVNQQVISNAIESTCFSFSELRREKVRKDFHFNDSDIVFITVGSVQERKGQKRFIKLIYDYGLDFKYLIVGAGPQSDEIRKLVNQLNLESQVFLIDFVSNTELIDYYSAADVYAHVSTAEGQALSAIEAICSGLPLIVASEIYDTLGEYISNRVRVINFSSVDAEFFKTYTIGFVNSYDRNDVSYEQFSWAMIAQKYSDFYESCLSNKEY